MGTIKSKRRRSRARYPGSDPDAKIVEEFNILREIYKGTDLPMWVIKKVCVAFLAITKKFLLTGHYIYFSGLGAFVPFKRNKGTRRFKNIDLTKTHIVYKWKPSSSFASELMQSTLREVKPDVDISQSGS